MYFALPLLCTHARTVPRRPPRVPSVNIKAIKGVVVVRFASLRFRFARLALFCSIERRHPTTTTRRFSGFLSLLRVLSRERQKSVNSRGKIVRRRPAAKSAGFSPRFSPRRFVVCLLFVFRSRGVQFRRRPSKEASAFVRPSNKPPLFSLFLLYSRPLSRRPSFRRFTTQEATGTRGALPLRCTRELRRN